MYGEAENVWSLLNISTHQFSSCLRISNVETNFVKLLVAQKSK